MGVLLKCSPALNTHQEGVPQISLATKLWSQLCPKCG